MNTIAKLFAIATVTTLSTSVLAEDVEHNEGLKPVAGCTTVSADYPGSGSWFYYGGCSPEVVAKQSSSNQKPISHYQGKFSISINDPSNVDSGWSYSTAEITEKTAENNCTTANQQHALSGVWFDYSECALPVVMSQAASNNLPISWWDSDKSFSVSIRNSANVDSGWSYSTN